MLIVYKQYDLQFPSRIVGRIVYSVFNTFYQIFLKKKQIES